VAATHDCERLRPRDLTVGSQPVDQPPEPLEQAQREADAAAEA